MRAGQTRTQLFFETDFCAEPVADSYMPMGLLSRDAYPPNANSPGTFTSDDPARLPRVNGAALGPSINVVRAAP